MSGSDPTTVHVGRALGGDARAMGWIVERFSPLLLVQARQRLGPLLAGVAEPEDVVGEAWATALPKLAELPERDGRRTPVVLRFLSSIVLNKVNNLLTRSLRRGEVRPGELGAGGSEAIAALPTSVTDALDLVVRDERARALREGIERLGEADRELVVLRGIEQRPNAEVAELLGIEPNTCAVRFRRALERLRGELPGTLLDELD